MARNKETNENMRRKRREKILSGALRLFAKRGVTATKISDIAQETGMSQGLVYNYFKSKEEIYSTLIGFAYEQLIDACQQLAKAEFPVRDKIHSALEGLINSFWNQKDVPLYYLITAQATVSDVIHPQLKALIEAKKEFPYRIMADILTEGQKEGDVYQGDVTGLAALFWSIIRGLAMYRAGHGSAAVEPDIKAIERLFLMEKKQ